MWTNECLASSLFHTAHTGMPQLHVHITYSQYPEGILYLQEPHPGIKLYPEQ